MDKNNPRFPVFEGEFEDTLDEAVVAVNSRLHNPDPCTASQRGYIYGLCKKEGYDPRDLPPEISPKPETRDLTVEEARHVIDVLRGDALI